MSTKTTFKRVALVTVAALGFGVLTSVAPASAAEEVAGTVTAINLTALTANTGAASTAQKVSVGLTTKVTGASGAADTLKITGKLTSYPIGGAVSVTGEASSVAVATACDTISDGALTFSNVAPYAQAICTEAADTATAAVTIASTAAGAGLALFGFTPTVVGTYVMTVWNDSNVTATTGLGVLNDNEVSQTVSFTVTSAGAVLGNQLPNSASTTASVTGATYDGHRVSSVGIETIQVSGRTGIQVGFAPQYRITRNGAAAAIAESTGGDLSTKFANIAYTVANPAGTAVTVYSAQGGTTASASQAIAGVGTIELGADNTTANTTAVTQSISPTTG